MPDQDEVLVFHNDKPRLLVKDAEMDPEYMAAMRKDSSSWLMAFGRGSTENSMSRYLGSMQSPSDAGSYRSPEV